MSSCSEKCIEKKFLKACKDKDKKRVECCLGLDVNVNYEEKVGIETYFGLWNAVSSNSPEICEILLAHPDIDVNKTGGCFDTTAFLESCNLGYAAITRLLIADPRVDVNCRCNDNWTAAIWAARFNRTECLNILKNDQRVDWNLTDTEGDTAAIMAVANNCTEAVKILSEIRSIDWNIVGDVGHTALTRAVKNGNAEIIKILFGIPSLEINIDKLREKKMYEKAGTAAKNILDSLMDNSGGDDYLMFALKTDLDKIAALLVSHVDTNLELLRKGSNVRNVEEKEETGAECPVKLIQILLQNIFLLDVVVGVL